jgi:hypothetical protein
MDVAFAALAANLFTSAAFAALCSNNDANKNGQRNNRQTD